MKTLRDFWNTADGVYDFIDKNGVSIDDMDYPLETEVVDKRLIEGEHYEVMLNVEVNSNRKEEKIMKMFNYNIPDNDKLVVFAYSKEEADKMVLRQYSESFDENGCDENGVKISEYESCEYEIPTEPTIHVCVSW